jgi:hypothetical protein
MAPKREPTLRKLIAVLRQEVRVAEIRQRLDVLEPARRQGSFRSFASGGDERWTALNK